MTSTQPRKQRRERAKAPLHRRQKFLRAPLSRDLREKYSKRNARVVKGDAVRVMRGDHAGTKGKVQSVDITRGVIIVEGVTAKKADDSEVARSINPSNVQIVKLYLKDRHREECLKR